MRKLKMSNRSKVALDKTLKKWKTIANGDKVALLIPCSLCKVYNIDKKEPCRYCPIKIKTGMNGCGNTPFWRFNRNSRNYKKQASAEVRFLESCYY